MENFPPGAVRCALVFLTLFIHASASPACAQRTALIGAGESATVSPAIVAGSPANEIVFKVLAENERRSDRLRSYTVTRTYQIRTLEGKLSAQTIVLMEFDAPDTKIFAKSVEKGSGLVRHLVFDRLMDSETESSAGKQRVDSALTPANYDFRFAGEEDLGPYRCFVLDVVPRRKDKYLFEGRIWIDTNDFAVAKIQGHPAKKLSFWLNQADFVREFQKVDGFWLPLRDETHVDVKLYGKRVFTIDHGHYIIQSQPTTHPHTTSREPTP